MSDRDILDRARYVANELARRDGAMMASASRLLRETADEIERLRELLAPLPGDMEVLRDDALRHHSCNAPTGPACWCEPSGGAI